MLDWMIEEGKKWEVAQGLEWVFSFLFFLSYFFFFLSPFFVLLSFFLSLLYKKGPFCALVLLKRKQAWNTNFIFFHQMLL